MKNGIFSLNWASLADAVLTAVVFSLVAAFVTLATSAGFDIFTADWGMVGHNMANLAVVSAAISLGKDFLSTSTGSLLNITPTNAPQQ